MWYGRPYLIELGKLQPEGIHALAEPSGWRWRERERDRERERQREREREYMYIEDMHVMHSAYCNDSRYHYLVLEFI